MLSITIGNGNTPISKYTLETPYNDTLDKTLDDFSFTYRTTSEPASMQSTLLKYAKVRVSDAALGLNKILALQSYTYKLEGNTWIYNINCISPTKLLENVIVNGMAETQKNDSLKTQFTRVLSKINNQSNWEGHFVYTTIMMSQRLQNFLNARSGRDFKWDGQVTAREIFDDFLRPFNAYIIASDFTPINGIIGGGSIGYVDVKYIGDITLDYVLENGADIDDLEDTDHEIARGTSIKNALITIDNGLDQDYKISGFESYNESEYEMDSCKTIVANAVPENYYNTGWTNLRSEATGIWSSDNVCLITDEPIYDVDRNNFNMILPASCSIDYVSSVSDNSYSMSNYNNLVIGFPVPLGNYLYEKAEYDILPESVQRKSLWYERGKCNIYGFTNKYKDNVVGKFNVVAIENIITEVSNNLLYSVSGGGVPFLWRDFAIDSWYSNYISSNPAVRNILTNGTTYLNSIPDTAHIMADATGFILRNGILYDGKQLVFNGTTNLYSVKNFSINFFGSTIDKILFNARYLPYVSAPVMSKKMDFDDNLKSPGYTKGLSIIENQNDKNVDLSRFCKSQQSLINRLGERIAYLDVKINTSKGGVLWPLGDFIRVKPNANDNSLGDCWKITQRELTQYNETTYKCRYTLSKNYNANNASITLDREKRTFDIPLDGFVDRYIYVKVPNTYDLSEYDSSLTYCVDYGTYSCYSFNNISKYSSDNIQFYKTTYIDNYSANIYKTKISDTKINAPLRYCDLDGTKSNLSISLVKFDDVMRKTNISALPRIESSDYSNIDKYSRTLTGIQKDPFERLIIVFYQDGTY